MGASLALGIGGSLLQGYFSNQAANSLASGQRSAGNLYSNYQGQLTEEMQNASRQLQPYAYAGKQILPQLLEQLQGGFQFDPTQDPAYLANMHAQEQAINRANAASGGFFSGQRGVDLATMMSDLASREYASQYDRYRSRLSDLSGMLSFGYGAQNDIQRYRSGYLGMIGDAISGRANAAIGESEARAAGSLATGQMFSGIGSQLGTYFGGNVK